MKITFSYFDGRNIKHSLIIKKGDTVREVLHRCIKIIEKDNKELDGFILDTFMMVKSDFIMPNHIRFMDYLGEQKTSCE